MTISIEPIPLRCEPIVRLSRLGLQLRAVEVMAGGNVALRYARAGKLLALDVLVARAAAGLELPPGLAIHLNLPGLGDGAASACRPYLDAISRLVEARPVVLEICEDSSPEGFLEAFEIATATGAELVVDDLAPGNNAWSWLSEDILSFSDRVNLPFGGKLDWGYFQRCADNAEEWEGFCDHLRGFQRVLTSLTVEGVERLAHLDRLRELARLDLSFDVQGFFLNDLYQAQRALWASR